MEATDEIVVTGSRENAVDYEAQRAEYERIQRNNALVLERYIKPMKQYLARFRPSYKMLALTTVQGAPFLALFEDGLRELHRQCLEHLSGRFVQDALLRRQIEGQRVVNTPPIPPSVEDFDMHSYGVAYNMGEKDKERVFRGEQPRGNPYSVDSLGYEAYEKGYTSS